jgi:hypothetical protein
LTTPVTPALNDGVVLVALVVPLPLGVLLLLLHAAVITRAAQTPIAASTLVLRLLIK